MLYYKDMTFCNNGECRKECDRRLTQEILSRAKAFGLYVCIAKYNCDKKEDK